MLTYDVIHDALRVICHKNLRRLRNLDDFGTGKNLAKKREIEKVCFGDIGPAI